MSSLIWIPFVWQYFGTSGIILFSILSFINIYNYELKKTENIYQIADSFVLF